MIRAACIVMVTLMAAFTATAAWAQTSSTTSTTTTSQTQQILAPASACFICDCNNQDFSCRTSCAAITDFVSRQRCEIACGTTQAQCLSNAQVLQRQLDTQRAAAQATTSSGATN